MALTRLDVNQNNIDEAGASALVDAAATANRSIVRLDLSWNDDVSKATKLKLARTLLRNVTDAAAAARDAEAGRRRRRRCSGRGGSDEQLEQLGRALVGERDLRVEGCDTLIVVAHVILLAPAEEVRRRRLGYERDHRTEF